MEELFCPADVIEGISWQLVAVGGAPAVPGTEATMTLNGGRVSGTTGCNRYTGTYELGSGRIAEVRPARDDPDGLRRARDGARAGLCQGAWCHRQWFFDRRQLGCSRTPRPPSSPPSNRLSRPRSHGVTWLATGINNGKGAVSSVVRGDRGHRCVRLGWQASWRGWLQQLYGAPYTADGDKLSIQQPVSRTACACDGAGVMEQEGAYLKAA